MLQERLRGLKELSPSEWAWPIALGVALLGFLVFLFWKEDAGPGLPITLGIVGLFVYRRFRNRRYRLTRRIVTRIKRLPEVRFVTAQRQCLTVVADQALAKTYVRVTAAVGPDQLQDVLRRAVLGWWCGTA